MGAPKIKCPGCGAKNDTMSRRCRVCAGLINMNIPEPGKGGSADTNAMPEQNFFDADDINQQLRPKSEMFKGGGGLGARIAAANGGASAGPPPVPSPDSWSPSATDGPSWGAGESFGPVNQPAPFEPQSFEPQSFGPQPMEPAFGPEAFNPDAFSRDETFTPAEFNVSKPDLPPLEVEEERFDPNALFRDAPGEF